MCKNNLRKLNMDNLIAGEKWSQLRLKCGNTERILNATFEQSYKMPLNESDLLKIDVSTSSVESQLSLCTFTVSRTNYTT